MTVSGRGVRVVIDGRVVLEDVDIDCQPGTVTALVGPSGSGKTTLLHCLGLLQSPTSGSVLIDGEDTSAWPSSRRRRFWREAAAFVLQDYGVMIEESVGFNVTMSTGLLGRRLRGDRDRMQASLKATGLVGRNGEPASHLSGGEKQRLAVARAIYKGAKVIYVDEPTASLDSGNRDRVITLFRERARAGCIVVVATHDQSFIEAADVRLGLGPQAGDVQGLASAGGHS